MIGFITEGEGAVVHGDEDAGLHFDEGAHGLLWVHVDIAAAGGIVGPDGHEGDVGGVVLSNFLKATEVGTVATVKDLTRARGNHVTAVVAVGIVKVAGTPVVARGVGDAEVFEVQGVPDGHFVHAVESEFFHERLAAVGDDDPLVRFEDLEAFFMEVVEVGVGDHDEIDEWHQGEVEAGFALAFDHAVPVGPVGVDDHRVVGKLDEKRCVTDPCDADFSGFGWVRDGFAARSVALLEDLGEKSVAKKVVIPAWPSFFGEDASVVFTGLRGACVGALGGHGAFHNMRLIGVLATLL